MARDKHQGSDDSWAMRADEARRMLGIGRNTLYSWCDEKLIPHKRVGRVILSSDDMNLLREIAFGAVKAAIGSVAGPWAGLGLDIFEMMIGSRSDSGSNTSSWAGQYYEQTKSRESSNIAGVLDFFTEEELLTIASVLSDNGKKWNIDKASKETVLLSIRNSSDKNELETLLTELMWTGVRSELEKSEGASTEESSTFFEGLSHFYRERYDAAIDAFSKALETNPGFRLAYLHRAIAYSEQKRYDQALADYGRVLELEPNNPLAYVSQGITYYEQERYGLAVYSFSRALDLDPNNAIALHNRQLACTAIQETPAQAESKSFQSGEQLNPEELCARGGDKLDRGDIAGALDDFNEAIRLDSKYCMAYKNRGYVRRNELDDIDGAIDDFTIALTLNPDDATVLLYRGNALTVRGDINGALNDYDMAIELAPDWARGYASRGYLLLYKTDETRKAIADFDIALGLDPEDAGTFTNRGNARIRMGDADGAGADFAKADSLNPGSASP